MKQQGADSSINSDATVRYACTSCSYQASTLRARGRTRDANRRRTLLHRAPTPSPQYAVERRVATGLHLEKKEVAEVLQEEGAWKGVPTTVRWS